MKNILYAIWQFTCTSCGHIWTSSKPAYNDCPGCGRAVTRREQIG